MDWTKYQNISKGQKIAKNSFVSITTRIFLELLFETQFEQLN